MKSHWKILGQRLCFGVLTASGLVSAQPVSETKFVATSWGTKEGLPQSSVNHVIQSRDGYLWLATFGGLVRFNGESFTTFDRSNSDRIPSDRMLSLYEDRSGDLWCGTEGGIVRFRNNRFTAIPIAGDPRPFSPLMVAEDARGRLWVSVDAKPYRFADTAFVAVPVLLDSGCVRRAVQEPGGVWIAHGRSLIRTLGDSTVLVKDFADVLRYDIQSVIEHPKHSGQIWIGTAGEGVVCYSGGILTRYGVSEGLPSGYQYRLSVDHDGYLWSAGFKGVSRWNGRRFIPLKTVAGDIDRELTNIVQDREGNYWAGTPAYGLHRLQPARVSMIGKAQGLTEEKTLSLMRLKSGMVLIGTNCGGVFEWDGTKAVYSSLNAQLRNLCSWSVFEDSRLRLWIGSKGLERFDPMRRHSTVFDTADGFTGRDVVAMMEDSKGTIWIGCLNGLYRYDGRRFHRYAKQEGLLSVEVRVLFEDHDESLWIGTTTGVFRRENGRIVPVPVKLQRSTGEEVSDPHVRAIHQDADGTMWFGTYGDGILRLKHGTWSSITVQEGLFDNIVSHIVEDDRQNFWMGSNRGISRVARKALNDVVDGTSRSVRAMSFGILDGMASPETNGGFQPSVTRDVRGRLFFPTVSGVAVIDTRLTTQNDSIPPVHIEHVLAGDHAIDRTQEILLSYDSADVEVRYTALSYVDRSKIRYRYMLEGIQEHWINGGTRTSAYFTNIPPGTWTFRVIASNNDGVWNMKGDSIVITVTPPFWRTWWFYAIAGLFFAAAGPSVYYVRVTQLKKEKREKMLFAEQLIKSQERERRRIAADLHDGLGQQILIIKNRVELALRSVSRPDQITEQLKEIALSAQSSLNDVRSISHGLRPVHLEQFGLRETLINLCDQVRQTSAIDWVCHFDDIDGAIPREQEINFYRIVQEGVNNILKHSDATQASIMIRRSDKAVTASIWDNGKGFTPDAVDGTKGLGLNGIQERADMLGGTCDILSAPGAGTTIMVTMTFDPRP